MKRGTTLLELLCAMAVAGTLLGLVAPSAARLVDRAAASAARESLVAAIAEARLRAIEEGGAELIVVRASRAAVIRSASRNEVRTLTDDAGVQLTVLPRRDSLRLSFDGIGIGRFTSASMVFRRGSVDRGLVLSAYGRVRRR